MICAPLAPHRVWRDAAQPLITTNALPDGREFLGASNAITACRKFVILTHATLDVRGSLLGQTNSECTVALYSTLCSLRINIGM